MGSAWSIAVACAEVVVAEEGDENRSTHSDCGDGQGRRGAEVEGRSKAVAVVAARKW